MKITFFVGSCISLVRHDHKYPRRSAPQAGKRAACRACHGRKDANLGHHAIVMGPLFVAALLYCPGGHQNAQGPALLRYRRAESAPLMLRLVLFRPNEDAM